MCRTYLKRFFYSCIQKRRISSSLFNCSKKDKSANRFSLHEPGHNYKAKGYVVTSSTSRLLKEHIEITGGKVRTRFPPEPNGILHIGHAKAINISFDYAKSNGGICYLRFDDTNPETEDKSYADGIIKAVNWLGYEPFRVTYASDYFPKLFEWAKDLIQRKHAYVCHERYSTEEEVKSAQSPWRNTDVEENLVKFEEMQNGNYKEGEAVLRLKFTTDQGTVDPVAYRIKLDPHHRTGTTWKVYPTYDYAHCLCDSIENVTHSLCTTEFELRRSTYYWVCNALEVYCPVQTEFGRLNLLYSMVSKRAISQLIENGYVKDWDDPRLYTLSGLRRRGFPASAINTFCQSFGMRNESSFVHPIHLEKCVRDVLNMEARRVMAVMDPVRVQLLDFPFPDDRTITVRNIPKDSSKGVHIIPFRNEVFIEASDISLKEDPNFYRLTPSQGVGLKNSGCIIYLKDVFYNDDGKIGHITATCKLRSDAPKPKAYIQWVSEPIKCKVRLFNYLFLHERPGDLESVPGGFLSDINPNSLIEIDALVDKSALDYTNLHRKLDSNSLDSETINPTDDLLRLQFERVGYFCLDSDSTRELPIFNKIVSLRQDSKLNK